MKLVTYYEGSDTRVGVIDALGVIPTSFSGADLYRQGHAALEFLETYPSSPVVRIPESSLKLAPVVPAPGKILCIGLNYRRHAAETGAKEPAFPLLFSKFNNTLAAQGEDVPVSASWSQVDYEAELGVVIGRGGKNISEADALDYVFGYFSANDISERALQFVSSQWLLGKTPDKFLPIGPYVVTADEAGDPTDMSVKGWLNGELRQNSSTSDMIFSVAQCISYASQYFTLEPGDIISTGTPEGVILGMKDKIWLKDGDVYEVEIGTLGRLKNRIVVV